MLQTAAQPVHGLVPGEAEDGQLDQQGVVDLGDGVTLIDKTVQPHPVAAGRAVDRDRLAALGHEVVLRILGVDPHLNGMTRGS